MERDGCSRTDEGKLINSFQGVREQMNTHPTSKRVTDLCENRMRSTGVVFQTSARFVPQLFAAAAIIRFLQVVKGSANDVDVRSRFRPWISCARFYGSKTSLKIITTKL